MIRYDHMWSKNGKLFFWNCSAMLGIWLGIMTGHFEHFKNLTNIKKSKVVYWPSGYYFLSYIVLDPYCPGSLLSWIPIVIPWYHMIWYHIIWCHIISYDIIWCHMISYDVIWNHMMPYDIIWCHMISYGIIWYHMIR